MAEAGDETLVRRATAGEPTAWEEIYRAVYPRLRAYIARHADGRDVDDLVSETMTRSIAGIRQSRSFTHGVDPWIFGIARRVVADHHRQAYRARRRRVPVDAPSHGSLADDTTVLAEEHRAVRAGFDQLPLADRELLELRVIAELSTTAAAQVLGKRIGAVRMAQSRALARLRALTETTP